MRFGKMPENQLNINFDAPENNQKTTEQIRDDGVSAVIADCEAANKRNAYSKPVETSIKKIKEMIESGQSIERVKEVDSEAERKTKEYWDKVYSGIRPKEKPEAAYLGKKIKKSPAGFIDYKKSQYKDDAAYEELN